MSARKRSSVNSLREESARERSLLDSQVALFVNRQARERSLLDDYHKQICGLNRTFDEMEIKPGNVLLMNEEHQNDSLTGSIVELRERVQSSLNELKRLKKELAEARQVQREQDAVVSKLTGIIVDALSD